MRDSRLVMVSCMFFGVIMLPVVAVYFIICGGAK